MDLSEISKIKEVLTEDEVNKFLDLGWKLLEKASYNEPDGYDSGIIYSLGWLSSSGEPKYPKIRDIRLT